MPSSRKIVILCMLLAACLFVGCKGRKERPPASGNSTSSDNQPGNINAVSLNRSKVVATVMDVVRSNESRFYLRLRIENVEEMAGYYHAVKSDQIIEAYPNFKREEGKELDYTTQGNQHMLNAENLKPGNRISAVVYSRGNSYLLMDWQRE